MRAYTVLTLPNTQPYYSRLLHLLQVSHLEVSMVLTAVCWSLGAGSVSPFISPVDSEEAAFEPYLFR